MSKINSRDFIQKCAVAGVGICGGFSTLAIMITTSKRGVLMVSRANSANNLEAL